MSARKSTCSSVSSVRDLVDGRVRERHAGVLGLQAVDQVAEDPAAAAGALAVVALAAEAAAATRVMQETSTRSPTASVVTAAPDSMIVADRLVTEDRPGCHLGHVALEDVQVGAADGGRVDADDHVRWLLNHRVGHGLPCLLRPVRDTRAPSWRLLYSGTATLGWPTASRIRVRPDGARGLLLMCAALGGDEDRSHYPVFTGGDLMSGPILVAERVRKVYRSGGTDVLASRDSTSPCRKASSSL